MKRPILIATIGYIIGIIMGLYLKISIVLLYIPLCAIVAIIKLIHNKFELKKRKFSIFLLSRYFRYIKLIFNHKVLIIIILFSVISNLIIILKNDKYEKLYEGLEDIEVTGVIVEEKEEKTYKNIYKIKVLDINNLKKFKNTYLYLSADQKMQIEYGNKIKVEGKYQSPEIARNYGGFNYKEYLKQIEIFGTINATKISILEERSVNDIEFNINKLKSNIKSSAKKYLDEDAYSIFLGLIIGDTSYIDEKIKEKFQISNMSHILAVSGMHISYIIMGSTILLNKILGKRKSKIITIFILVLYILITGFSASIIRASTMGIIILLSGVIHRKSDTITSIAVSLLITLIYNPYLIENIGLQFSYMGTIGIIFLNKNVFNILNRNKEKRRKIKSIISVSISAYIFIFPLTIFHFNLFGPYFLFSNILISFIIGPTIILSFMFLILSIFNLGIIELVAMPINIFVQLLLQISNLSFLPFAKIYFPTPKIWQIAIFYIVIIISNLICSIKKKKNPSAFNLRVRYMLQVFKYKFVEFKKSHRKSVKIKIVIILLISVILRLYFIILIPNNLKINFVDVGQGDCCFIETPNNKSILIDGGGSESGSFDVGKKTLLPYLLDKGYTKIDYIIISHFDSDHVRGLLTIMKELKVDTVVISKQGESSGNYESFKQIVKEKNIKVLVVESGDAIKIEKDLYFDILWPNNSKFITENALNNNSIVCKLHYKNFSILFTGDIEEIAEKQILQEYKNNLDILNSTILKVGHHGSKTSSIQEFLESVKPQIALIGVGENNKFGHPNVEVLNRLENNR